MIYQLINQLGVIDTSISDAIALEAWMDGERGVLILFANSDG